MDKSVAIVGAGIAGMGAAWALHRSGARVTVFEREPDVGGNAKTHAWDVDGREIVTGLSVLAWPDVYFHNYRCLLAELGIATERTPTLRFFVKDRDDVYAHGLETAASRGYASDVAAWERLVAVVRRVNGVVSSASAPTLYDQAPHNPFHFVPLAWLARRFGVSRRFWERVFVPIHSSSFLSVDLDTLPASIAPALDDIVSIARGGELRTWSGTSREVFVKMSEGFADRVHRGAPVVRVDRSRAGERGGVAVEDARGRSGQFDAVVFACDALTALEALRDATPIERALLGGVLYPDGRDATFVEGVVHADVSVLPEAHRDEILRGFANYVERIEEPGGKARYENTFVLSSWVPAARGLGAPMLVSYNKAIAPASSLRRVANRRAHPCLTPSNLARAWLLRAIQGRRSTFYCGSYATPGNGHDLSLLSGLVAAGAAGAAYPFASDERARADYQRLRKFMLRGRMRRLFGG